MAQGKQALKARIKSVTATKKIISAMELISNSKLQKQRNLMEKNKEYAATCLDTMNQILDDNKTLDNRYLRKHTSSKVLTILFSSDLGLCGGYNSNMLRLTQSELNPEDPILVIGSKARRWLSVRGFNVLNDYINGDSLDFIGCSKLANQALEMFLNDEICRIQVLYTEFINTVSFKPVIKALLPREPKEQQTKGVHVETLFEPSADEILNELIPMAIRSELYSLSLETKTSEQASRRVAMENANDNAEELTEKLVLQYNQARQAAITQEIAEIVAGADSL